METRSQKFTTETEVRLITDIGQLLSVEGQAAFADYFVAARDKVENAFYAELDRGVRPRDRALRLFGTFLGPLLGRPIKDVEAFYDFIGRLTRWAWLSASQGGIYSDAILAIKDPARRLLVAQVNTVDTAWAAAYEHLQNKDGEGLVVDVGTGRGNSVVRLAYLFPRAKIVSITLSPTQATIASRLARDVGADNAEVRLGDLFDPATTRDLIGQADAVTAIEVTGHFPPDLKAEGFRIMAAMLKPGRPLSLIDLPITEPTATGFRKRYSKGYLWYYDSYEGFLANLESAGVALTKYAQHRPSMVQSFVDTADALRAHRAQLRAEFGSLVAALWPAMVKGNLSLMKKTSFAHIQGQKQ